MVDLKKRGHELHIRVSGLSNGLYDYHFTAEPTTIGLSENFTHPVEVGAHLDKTPGQMYLRVEIKTAADFECDRCLDGFTQSLVTRYEMFYVFDEIEAGKYVPEEVTVITPDTVQIDLSEDVREMIVMAVPLKLLCREGCKGLCPRCGANWNLGNCSCKEEVADPRWSGLQNLLKQ